MQIDLKHFKELFLQESSEHIADMESALLSLRAAPRDLDVLNAIFRAAHSIKGGAGTFGLNEVVRFTHSLESLLDKLRAEELAATVDLVELLLKATDVLAALLEEREAADAEQVLAALDDARNQAAGQTIGEKPERSSEPKTEQGPRTNSFRVHFRPSRGILATGCNPLLLLRNLGALGEVTNTVLNTEELPEFEEFDPSQCYLSWIVDLSTTAGETAIREVFEFVEGDAEIRVEALNCVPSAEPVTVAAAAPVIPDSPSAEEHKPVTPSPVAKEPDPAVTAKPQAGTAPKAAPRESASVRVSTEKLDELINLVGEMVIANAMVLQTVDNFSIQDLPRLRESAGVLERHTREIHERIMAVRMLPVGGLFGRFRRLVHDLATKTGKQIQLKTTGEETEVDKSMLEQLSDPLTHLIRNSCDHGLESAEERRAAGKPDVGTIGLHAYHRAGNVVLEVSDDGRGLDVERIREKAARNGLIPATADLTREQIQMLIFEPGFSTCEQVSDLSGRGVGMDVVRQNIKALNGSLSLQSEPGKGLMIRLQVPLTLAILDGLIVRVGDQAFVLPLLGILETIPLTPQSIRGIPGHGDVVLVRDEPLPVLRLDRLFHIPDIHDDAEAEHRRQLGVVVEQADRRVILVVDELMGQQQVVIKSLEKNFRRIEGAMGATILGDGKAAIILDISALTHTNLSRLYGGGQELVA